MDTNKAVESVNTELSKAYIAGLMDTSSTINARIVKARDYRLGFTIEPIVAISRESGLSVQIVDEYCMKNSIFSNVNKRDDRYELQISRNEDVARFLEQIEPYLQDRREEAQYLRETIIPQVQQGVHLSDKEGFVGVVRAVDRLREMNPREPQSEYTEEYFRKEWDL